MHSIRLGRFSKDQADRLKARLHNETFMCWQIVACPHQGQWVVHAQTDYPASSEKVRSFLFYVLADELTKEV